jgi:dTDP-4-dehydrorhamnose reductase
MTILVLGAGGMLGFALHRVLSDRGFKVLGTVRGAAPVHPWTFGLDYLGGLDVRDVAAVRQAVRQSGATIVVNAAGVIKQAAGARDPGILFAVNSAVPRRLQATLGPIGVRLVHFSTDCVFSGRKGGYSEADIPDADDDYGLSKYLGEPAGEGCLVLRTSIIGLGLAPNPSLVDWFLSQTGAVRAYRPARFSGLPVHLIGALLADRLLAAELSGLWHLSAEPIDKAALLTLIRDEWGRPDIRLEPDDAVVIDRSLDSSRLRARLGWLPSAWPDLVAGMRAFYQTLGPRPA